MAETRFHSLLKERVLQETRKMSDSLGNGEATDWARYKEMSGFIQGLYASLKLCDEIEKEFD